ncbi:hypothetical protein FOL47_004186 [Perkinsus chesapeaki]|uniref:Uncharacterized protein n=1 Tax=Perkinsus chesapeaki TaxID=330153 RepID=A0A7J6MZX2_PERCH|nr:hypothetical protein FOL47_004186 [Perkinsus chesapeaki]
MNTSLVSLLGRFSDWLLSALRAYLYYDIVAQYREAVAEVVASVMTEGGRPFKALTELQRLRREHFLRPLKELLGSQVNLRELKSRVDQLVGSTADEVLFDPSLGPEKSLVLGPSAEDTIEHGLTTRGIHAVHRFAGIILSEGLSTIELALWRLRVSPTQQSPAISKAAIGILASLSSGISCYLLPWLQHQQKCAPCAFLRFLTPLDASAPPVLLPLAPNEVRILNAQLHSTASEFFGYTYCELALQAGAGQARKLLPVNGNLSDILPSKTVSIDAISRASSWLSSAAHPLYYSFTVTPISSDTMPPAMRLQYDLLLNVTSQYGWGDHREPFIMSPRKWMIDIPSYSPSKRHTRIAVPMDIMDDSLTEVDKDIGDVYDDDDCGVEGIQANIYRPMLYFHILYGGNATSKGVTTVRLSKDKFFLYMQRTCFIRRMPTVRRWGLLALMLLAGGGGGGGGSNGPGLTISVLSRLHVVRPFFPEEAAVGHDRRGHHRSPVVCPCVRVAGLDKGVCLFDAHRASQPHRVLRQPTLDELEASMELALTSEDMSMRLSDLRDMERQIRFELPRNEPNIGVTVLSAVGNKLIDTWYRVKGAWDEVDDDEDDDIATDGLSTNDEDERDEELLAPDPKWGVELSEGPLVNKKETEFMWDFISPLASQLPPDYEPEPEDEAPDNERLLPQPDRASSREGASTSMSVGVSSSAAAIASATATSSIVAGASQMVYTYGPMTPPNSVSYIPMFEYKNGNVFIDHYQKITIAHPPSVWHWKYLPSPSVPQSPIVSLPATAAASALLQGSFALATSLYDLQHKRCSKRDVYRSVFEAASRGSAVGACCWTLANVAKVTNVAVLSGTVSLLWLALRAVTVHSRDQLLSDACVSLSGTAAAVAGFLLSTSLVPSSAILPVIASIFSSAIGSGLGADIYAKIRRWRQAGSKQRLVRLARMMLGLPRDGTSDAKVDSRWRVIAGMVHPDRRGDEISMEDRKLFELFMLCREIVKLAAQEKAVNKSGTDASSSEDLGPLYLEDGGVVDSATMDDSHPSTSIEKVVAAVQRFAYVAIVEPQLQGPRHAVSSGIRSVRREEVVEDRDVVE